jgi:hypothetical protein
MIRYSLVCEKDHPFESWFPDSRSFDRLAKGALLSCPACGSSRISKALMAPAVVASKKKAKKPSAETPPAPNIAMLDEPQRRLRELAKELRQEIIAKTDDVGARFPEEARAIHAGDAPQRSIRGQASMAEARELLEEGVEVMPIPSLPDEFN